jgi:toxin ParE1/3/4
MTIHLTRSARQDLEAIRTFTVDRWGRQQWLNYYRGMAAVLEQIAAAPDAGRNRDVLFPGVRSISYKAHLILGLAYLRVSVQRFAHLRNTFKRFSVGL